MPRRVPTQWQDLRAREGAVGSEVPVRRQDLTDGLQSLNPGQEVAFQAQPLSVAGRNPSAGLHRLQRDRSGGLSHPFFEHFFSRPSISPPDLKRSWLSRERAPLAWLEEKCVFKASQAP